MADYSVQNALAKIYQFIGRDSQNFEAMDKDGSKEITEAECRYFISENFEAMGFNVNEENNKSDIISKFWKSINTNRAGDSLVVLDEKEMAALVRRAEMENAVTEYAKNLKPITGLPNAGQWVKNVEERLRNAIAERDNGIESFKDKNELIAFLDTIAPDAMMQANGVCIFASKKDNILRQIYGTVGENSIPTGLQEEINNYIDGLKASDFEGKTDEEIIQTINDAIDEIVTVRLKDPKINDTNHYQLQKELEEALLRKAKEDDELKTLKEDLKKEVHNFDEEIEGIIKNFATKKFAEYQSNNMTVAEVRAEIANIDKLYEDFKKSEALMTFKVKAAKEVVKGEFEADKKQNTVDHAKELKDETKVPDYSTKDPSKAIVNASKRMTWFMNTLRDITKNKLKAILGDDFNENKFMSEYMNAYSATINITNDTQRKDAIIDQVFKAMGVEKTTTGGNKVYSLLAAKSTVGAELAKAILDLNIDENEALKTLVNNIAEKLAKKEISRDQVAQELADGIEELVAEDKFDTIIKELEEKKKNERQAKIKELINDDKRESIVNNLSDIRIGKAERLTFRVLDDGTVEFVEYVTDGDHGGVFNNEQNKTLQGYVDKIKKELETQYKEQLDLLGLTPTGQKNLFNAAVLKTMQNMEMYKNQNLNNFVVEVVETYKNMINKIYQDETAKKYIENYHNNSLLAGRTPLANSNFDDVAASGMTNPMHELYGGTPNDNGGDAQACMPTQIEDKDYKGRDGQTYKIKTWTDGSSDSRNIKDYEFINNTLESILGNYINKYKDILPEKDIVECFKNAEESAFEQIKKMDDVRTVGNADGLYGYSEYKAIAEGFITGYDSQTGIFISTSAIFMQVIYEMEKQLASKILGQK